MPKMMGLVLVGALAGWVSLAGVGVSGEAPPSVRIGTSFALALNQSTVVEGRNVTVRFDAVPSDSRCPVEVSCVWAGMAAVVLAVGGADLPPTTVTLDTLGTTGQAEGLRFSLVKLNPPPSINVPSPDYVAVIRVDLLKP